MVDWAAHYDAIYAAIGVPCVLSVGSASHDLTAIDKTAGVSFEEGINVHSLKPGVCVRTTELTAKSVNREDLKDATLVLNGATWRVISSFPRPAPTGEAQGEVLMILTEGS